ncbi:MAG TPA: hypothetical protein VJU14_11730 [Solirubrobacterales bacterium]|nr:hypothetical protein [Solirubrobacterales bacterium]
MTRLDELVEVNPREHRGEALSVISIADIDAEFAVAHPRRAARGDRSQRLARPGDVLLARISPSMENGKVAIVPELDTPLAMVSPELMVLRPRSAVDPRLVWAFFRQKRIRAELKRFTIGSSGRQRLRSGVLEKLDIPVPGERAWEKNSRALAHLDEARRLRRRASERMLAIPGAAATLATAGAPLAPLRSLRADLRAGSAEVSIKPGRPRVLRAPNLVRGKIDYADTRFLAPSRDGLPDLLRKGDLLVTRAATTRERIGACAVYDEEREPAGYSGSLIRIRSEGGDPDFLWAYLRSAEARAAIATASAERSDRYRLTVNALANLQVPRLSADEEVRIGLLARAVRRSVEVGEDQATLLERTVDAHLARTFGGQVDVEDTAAAPRPAAPQLLSHAFEAASERQQQLWRLVSEQSETFGLADLARSEADHAWIQHCLAIFEQLGLVVRESVGQSYRWRQPDAELEVLG